MTGCHQESKRDGIGPLSLSKEALERLTQCFLLAFHRFSASNPAGSLGWRGLLGLLGMVAYVLHQKKDPDFQALAQDISSIINRGGSFLYSVELNGCLEKALTYGLHKDRIRSAPGTHKYYYVGGPPEAPPEAENIGRMADSLEGASDAAIVYVAANLWERS